MVILDGLGASLAGFVKVRGKQTFTVVIQASATASPYPRLSLRKLRRVT